MDAQHEIVELEAFGVIGLGLDCAEGETQGIGPLWEEQFFPRWQELDPQQRVVGVCFARTAGFRYLAAAEMPKGSPVPPGMEAAIVPAGRYVKVRFVGKPQEMPVAFETIFSELLPAVGLAAAPGMVCLEDYPHDCMDEATGTLSCDLYVQLAGESS